jgi:hypothetical protein
MCARLVARLDLLELGSSPAIFWTMSSTVAVQMKGLGFSLQAFRNSSIARVQSGTLTKLPRRLVRQFSEPVLYQIQPARAGWNKVTDKARQRHLLRGAVSALPLPKLRLLSRRQLDRQTHVGHGMRHSKSHKLCLVIYRTLH